MPSRLTLGELAVELVRKDIKHVHLSVHPPTGRVRISAPKGLSLETIRAFAISKLSWIHQQRRRLRDQERETRRDFVDRESHYLWGSRYLMSVVERDGAPAVELEQRRMRLLVREGSTRAQREAVVARWYRDQLRAEAAALAAKWEPLVGARVERLFVQHMKTRWGSCNPRARTIRLNTELAKKPAECLEYVLVHEMAHLLEPSHNAHFVALMDRFLPRWPVLRQRLNRFPVRHEDWDY